MSILKKIFSWRTMLIIVGTCICIWVILFTLLIIESGFFSDYGRGRWVSRVEELDDFISGKKIKLFTDTVNGDMFQFKEMLVIPLVEITSDSSGVQQKILNFKMYDTEHKTESTLFQTNQEIRCSKLIQMKSHLIWFIEANEQFFIYDNQGTDLIASPHKPGYTFVYPETSDIDIERLDSGEQYSTVKKTEMPDTYLVNNSVSSFSIIGNQLLLYAQKDRDKQYWVYDLTTKEIHEITAK